MQTNSLIAQASNRAHYIFKRGTNKSLENKSYFTVARFENIEIVKGLPGIDRVL